MWIYDEFGNRKWIPNTRFSRAMNRVFKKDENGGEGGGGGGEGSKTPEQIFADKVEAAAAAKVLELKNHNQTLIEENKTAKKLKAQLDAIGGEEGLKNLSTFKSQIEQDEILNLASQGKHKEAFDKHSERLQLQFNEERTTLSSQLDESKTELASAQEQLNILILDGSATREFISEKGEESAIPDITWRIRQVFKVEKGQPVARDAEGVLLQGANGNALTVKEYVQSLRKTAPHLFPRSTGADMKTGSDGRGMSNDQRLAEAAAKGASELRRVENLIAEENKKAKT